MIASLPRSCHAQNSKPWKHSPLLTSITCRPPSLLTYVQPSAKRNPIDTCHSFPQRPTLLAKIFGCFKISFKKTQKDRGNKSKPTHMNLLVMENLFYDRRFSKVREQLDVEQVLIKC